MSAQRNRDAAREASDYFNALPIEERKKLAPLLEDYRRLGIEEAMRDILGVTRRLNDRACSIVAAAALTSTKSPTTPEEGS